MEDFDKDHIKDLFNELEKKTLEEIELTEENLESHIKIINKFLNTIDESIKTAEEKGDEKLYNSELNRKHLILQRLNELEILSNKIKK